MKALALIPVALAAATLAPAAAALAQPPEPAAAPSRSLRPADPRFDPNQLICRSEPEPGSRLMGHRRCLTRAQWVERSRLDRQYAEKAQTSRTFCGGICTRQLNHGR